ncbi:MAG: 1-acyl-sn-glycerol-3-phosphate acyltransferase [Rhodobacteraceae bacterium HLUCCA08]|nr:MAG: 1-acyl-sn-glycerol-3-phosphate acyltransferase [Rhodobacteraceae bacterium HLUCCA08]
MSGAVQWLRSLAFVGLIYFMMLPVGLIYLPAALRSRDGAVAACHAWCRVVKALMPPMVGLRYQVRGTPPTGEVMIAAKHQSFLDIILIYSAVPRGKFIMKKELLRAPILGWYAKRIGCVPVDRGKRAEAIRQMVRDVRDGRADPGQLIIYPQGTRIAPGVKAPYKAGSGALYAEIDQPCVPVACNVGLFWPRKGILRKPGLAVVDFLDPIPSGLAVEPFMAQLEQAIEARSDALMAEAGFNLPGQDER